MKGIGEFVKVKDLRVGDLVKTYDNWQEIKSIEYIQEKVTVYNPISVSPYQNYFANDVLAGVEFLKTRNEIDKNKIGLMGHSEGGIIAPMAASQSDDITFIVLLAGTGLTGEEILYLQGALILKANGANDTLIQKNRIPHCVLHL